MSELSTVGAVTVVLWAACKDTLASSWFDRMIVRRPKMLVAIVAGSWAAGQAASQRHRRETSRLVAELARHEAERLHVRWPNLAAEGGHARLAPATLGRLQ
jgi:hypothetical protein